MQFALSLILSYIFGLLILNIIDNRLSQISINMPTIKVNVVDRKHQKEIEGFHNTGRNCPQHYKNPSQMNTKELNHFKKQYRKNFTKVDYINWLMLQCNNLKNLASIHVKNFQNLLCSLSGPKKEKTYPSIKYLKNDDRFMLKRDRKLLERLQKPQMLPFHSKELTQLHSNAPDDFLAYNYSDFPQMASPQDVGSKSPILDVRNHKIDAHELNYYIRPSVVTGSMETNIGRQYEQTMKNCRRKQK